MKLFAPLLRFWHRLSSTWLLIPLLILATMVTVAQWWLAQLPTALAGDTIATSLWLDAQAASGWLRWLGLYQLAQQPWVRIMIALLAVILVLRLGSRLWLAWQVRCLQPPLTWLPLCSTLDSSLPGQLSLSDLQGLSAFNLRHEHRSATEHDDWQWFADRNHGRAIWQGLLELGLLLLVGLLAWQLRAGWQSDALIVAPGETVSLAPYAAQSLQMDGDGQMIRLCCQPEATMSLNGGRMRIDGLSVAVQRLLPVLQVQAQSAQGPLSLQSVDGGEIGTTLLLQFPQERSERAVAIPARNLVLVAVAQNDDRFQLQLRDVENTPIISDEITQSGELLWQDVRIAVQVTHAGVLQVRYRPGGWLLWPAGLMALFGLCAVWRWPYVRLGLRGNAAGTAFRWQGQWGAHPTPQEIMQLLAADEPDRSDE